MTIIPTQIKRNPARLQSLSGGICSFRCGSVRVVRGKKPEYSLLCAEADDKLSDGQQLNVMRLRAELTIRESIIAVSKVTPFSFSIFSTASPKVVLSLRL